MTPSVELSVPEPLPASTERGFDDAGLVKDTLEGDASAFDEIVRTHHRRVFNFVFHLTRHRQDAEDLTQLTFIKGFTYLGAFDGSRP